MLNPLKLGYSVRTRIMILTIATTHFVAAPVAKAQRQELAPQLTPGTYQQIWIPELSRSSPGNRIHALDADNRGDVLCNEFSNYTRLSGKKEASFCEVADAPGSDGMLILYIRARGVLQEVE